MKLILASTSAFIAICVGVVVNSAMVSKPGTDSGIAKPDFDKLLAVIRPGDGEDPFATIPWETNLWEARTKAAKLGKPILLWEMDGHPLGCG